MPMFSTAILTGTDASKSSVSPAPSSLTVGRLFFASDTGIVYRDNGTTFVNMDVSGGGGGGTTFNFGNGTATASGGEFEVILGSIPITGSLSIFVAGSILPPDQWSIPSGSVDVTLNTALTAGQIVVATWSTTNATPGGVFLSAGLPAPVEQWLMNEGSGNVFHTSSGSGNNLNASNITWASVAGFPGTVPVFNGSNSSATGVNQTNTNFTGTTPFSVSVWALVTSFAAPNEGGGTLVTTLQGGNLQGWEVAVNGDASQFQLFNMDLINNASGNNVAVVASSQPSIGVIHHFCATYDGSQRASGITLYLDGVAQAVNIGEDDLTASIANTQPIVLGGRTTNGTCFFDGSMADVRIYDLELNSSQVGALFTAGPA
jgi:Concanavalin A-like lectin/glucanases superfamily